MIKPRSRDGPDFRLLRDLRVVFLVTILLPGLVLAVVGMRSWFQERAQVDQQIRARLDRSADLAALDLEKELRQWQLEVDRIGPPHAPQAIEAAILPARIRAAVEGAGAAVVALVDQRPARIVPQLLYQLDSPPELPGSRVAPTTELAAAELIELRDKNYPGAIAAYRQLLATTSQRAVVLHRLARTYRKAGDFDSALKTYGRLEGLGDSRVGILPADLIARYESCRILEDQGLQAALAIRALAFYTDLVNGRWPLDRSRYLFYSDGARQWLARDPLAGAYTTLDELEQSKRALAEAVEALLAEPPRSSSRRQVLHTEAGTHVVFWRSPPSDAGPHVALALAAGFLAGEVWPRVFAAGRGDDLDGSIVAPNGQEVFRSAGDGNRPTATSGRALSAVRTLQDAGGLWRVEVWPRDPAAVFAHLNLRQVWYLAMLVLVVALLVSGTYLTTRTVRKELEFARLTADFVSTVSHEFRSPLTGIRQLGELLMRGRVPSDERRQQYYELITRESERLARLVDNLLDFARLEAGQQKYRFESFDPGRWLHELVSEFQAELPADRAPVTAVIPEALPSIVADRDALSSAVHNLLDNAVKYSPSHQPVRLDAEAHGDRFVIRVSDRGAGIADADRKHVFEKFYRGSGETARQVKGAGLGLSLVHHIVTAHGGRVEFESRPDQGTTFSIELRTSPS